ncbi:peptidyl-tRNA hydrolase [Daedaleopsis nitida]|nr:peptidyl-tRNA hydrolase [Daedaleopsis nitida]
MANPHFLVAGLGNMTHPRTRHSIGHLMIDVLAARLGASLSSERLGFCATRTVQLEQGAVTLTLFKPSMPRTVGVQASHSYSRVIHLGALMNISGRPVAEKLRATAVKPTSMIVIHDSLDHRMCTVYPKAGGSAGGHNGVRSIITALGNINDFHRLRLGIGRDENIVEYVLGPLSAQELEHWSVTGPGSDLVWNALSKIIQKSLKG